jgi:hypothetical protein
MNRCERTETPIAGPTQHPSPTIREMVTRQVSSSVSWSNELRLARRQILTGEAGAHVPIRRHPSCDDLTGLLLPATLIPRAYPVTHPIPPAVAFTLTAGAAGRSSRGATVKAGAGDHGRPIAWQRMRHPVRSNVTTSRSMGNGHSPPTEPIGILVACSPCVQAPSLQ